MNRIHGLDLSGRRIGGKGRVRELLAQVGRVNQAPGAMARVLGRWFVLGGLCLAVFSQGAMAQSATAVYRCEGRDGTPLYQNVPGKGCRQLDLPPINSVPAAKLPLSSTSRTPDARQENRDSDRRRILEQELTREQARLDEVRREYNDGAPERQGDERNYQKYLDRVAHLKDQLNQAQQNVSSLRREIDSLH